jgi:hypothetical protein
MQVVAIDWSGNKAGGAKTIWSAMSSNSHLSELFNGKNREEVADCLIKLAEDDSHLVVGLDFPFSMPAWFVRATGATDGPEFWKVVVAEGENWLKVVPDPF